MTFIAWDTPPLLHQKVHPAPIVNASARAWVCLPSLGPTFFCWQKHAPSANNGAMNPQHILKVFYGEDTADQQAQMWELAWFVMGFVILIGIVALTASALRAILLSRVKANEKRVWVILILALPIIGPCAFYATRRILPRR